MSAQIKFVYFDIGGVAILDFSGTNKWEKLQEELGIPPERSKEFREFWKIYGKEICLDRDIESLLPLIKSQFGVKLPQQYSLLKNGFVNRFEINHSIGPVIKEIHKSCRVGLLTNMYLNMFEAIKEKDILPSVSWDVIVDSSKVKLEKPDPKIYILAEQLSRCHGKEILFVENTPKHIEAASQFNWKTFLYDPTHSEESSQKLAQYFSSLIKQS